MTRTRLGLLGLCAMVFGLMAFSATAAHAEAGALWLVLHPPSGPTLIDPELPVVLEAETTGVLHSKIAGITVLFECKKLEAKEAFLKKEGRIGNNSKIKFSECITKLNGVTSGPCEPKAGGTEKGVINTNPGHALAELHELADKTKHDVVLVLPTTGETFATIEMSEECAIGEKVPVIGKAALKDCENLALAHLVRHLVEAFTPLTQLWTISKTAEHVATILGSGWASLGGAGVGLPWSVDLK